MKSKTKQRSPGRPMAVITIPRGKFTFADMIEANKHVTPLTLRKFLKRDAAKRNKSEITLVKGETRQPASSKGLGRKTFVYSRRAKAATSLKTARKSNITMPLAPITETPAPEAIAAEVAEVAAEASIPEPVTT